jgi:hypothetical protein
MSRRSKGLRARISPQRLAGPLVVAVAALAAPPLAHAADAPVDVTGTIDPGSLSIAAPQIVSNFTKALDGHKFIKTLEVPDWTVTDATGAGAGTGYDVMVAATAPTIGGASAGTGATVELGKPETVVNEDGLTAAPSLVGQPTETLTETPVPVAEAATSAVGKGAWTFSHGADNADLSVVIPADAPTGAYRTTLTFTVNAKVS